MSKGSMVSRGKERAPEKFPTRSFQLARENRVNPIILCLM